MWCSVRSKRLNLALRVVSLPCNNTSAIGGTRILASRAHGAFIGSRPKWGIFRHASTCLMLAIMRARPVTVIGALLPVAIAVAKDRKPP
jgi:hypothetical protein